MATRVQFVLEGVDRVSGVLGKAGQSMDRLGQVAGRVGRGVEGLLGTFAGIGGILGGAAFVGGISDAINKISELGTESKRLAGDLSLVPYLSELSYVASNAWISLDAVTDGLKELQIRTSEAAAGTGEGVEAFDRLGISAKKLLDVPLDRKLEILSEAFAQVTERADQLLIADQLLGDAGSELIKVMDLGTAGMEAQRREARELGIALTDEQAAGAIEAARAAKILQARMEAVTQQLAIKAAPTIEAIANFIGNDLPTAIELADKAWRGFLQGIRATAGGVAEGLAGLVRGVDAANAATMRFTGGLVDVVSVPEGLRSTLERFAEDMETDFAAAMRGGSYETRQFKLEIDTAGKSGKTLDQILLGLGETNAKTSTKTGGRAKATRESSAADREAAAASKKMERALKSQANELQTLQESLFPDQAKYDKYIEDLGILQAAYERGAISAERLGEAQFSLQKQFNDQPLRDEDAAKDLKRALERQADDLKGLQESLFPDEALRDAYIEDLAMLQSALERGAISTERFKAAQSALTKQLDEDLSNLKDDYSDVFETLSDTASRAFGDMLRDGEFSFKRLRTAIIDALADQAIQRLLNGIGSLFSGGAGGGGGVVGALGSLFGGMFADGGNLLQGRWGIVGDDGPEIAYAGSGPMTIQPIDAGGVVGGGMTVVQNFAIHGAADRRTQEQIAAAATRGLDRVRFRGMA